MEVAQFYSSGWLTFLLTFTFRAFLPFASCLPPALLLPVYRIRHGPIVYAVRSEVRLFPTPGAGGRGVMTTCLHSSRVHGTNCGQGGKPAYAMNLSQKGYRRP